MELSIGDYTGIWWSMWGIGGAYEGLYTGL